MKKSHQASRLSTPVGYLRSKVGGFVSRVILEIDDNQDILKGYLWGMDLSGTSQGAGGVGGLLAMVDVQETIAAVAFYDANGNLTQLYDWINEEVIAHYEYNPFGGITNQSGTYADANTFRFSTKYLDGETGLYYYGFRYYDPETGRWLNRDPIGERGGLNLYAFVGNDPVNWWDLLGLSSNCCGGSPLRAGQRCCQNQQISSSKSCCNQKECIANAMAWFDNCYTGCNLGAATFSALGSTVSWGLTMTGVGAPAGLITGGITVGGTAAIGYFFRRDCRNTRDRLITRCYSCGLS